MAQVSTSFLVIFLLYGLVVPLVIGLFFLIVTLQKARTLTLLRAIGARSSTLVWALLVQVLVVVGLGVAIGTLLYLPVSFMRIGSIPLQLRRHSRRGLGAGHPRARAGQLVVLGPAGAGHRAGRGALGWRGGLVKLALREMRRRPGRFATAAALLTLIAMLLMLLGGLLDGLIARSTGAINAQRADLVVFSATAEKSLLRSRITPAHARAGRGGARGHEGRWHRRDPARSAGAPATGPRDLVDVALFGYQSPPRGVPSAPAPGEAYADSILRDEGVRQGDTLHLGPARTPVRVVGLRRRRRATPAPARCGRRPRPGATCRTPTGPASSVGTRACSRRSWCGTDRDPSSVATAIDRATGATTRDRLHHRRGRLDRRRAPAAFGVQPDHRRDARDRDRGGRAVLRAAHRRAHRALRRCSRRSAPARARSSAASCSRPSSWR